jgi:uncharacterized membrane protein
LESSFLASLHPKVVHFPIALLTTYSLLEIIGIVFNKDFISKSALLILCLGVFTAFLAVLTGNQASQEFNFWNNESKALLIEHQNYATYLLWSALAVCTLRILLTVKKKFSDRIKFIFILFAIAILFLVYETGIHGGNLVKKYGVGTNLRQDSINK